MRVILFMVMVLVTALARAESGHGESLPLFQQQDLNRDGRLSRREFRGPTAAFDQVDRNRDGVITLGEAVWALPDYTEESAKSVKPAKPAAPVKPVARVKPVVPEVKPVSRPAPVRLDVLVHLAAAFEEDLTGKPGDFAEAARQALAVMDGNGVRMAVVMPPAQAMSQEGAYTYAALLDVLRRQQGRLAFLGGGGSLNVLIQEAMARGEVTDLMVRRFRKEVREMVDKGAAGFGELAINQLAFTPRERPLVAPADHPLFLLLADLAAEHDLPLLVRMEAVVEPLETPAALRIQGNPERLAPNIPAFERLLQHNLKARVVWAGLGCDPLGQRTSGLMRRLLEEHPNLYVALRVPVGEEGLCREEGRLLAADGGVKSVWLGLFQDFPERFLLGSEETFLSSRVKRKMAQGVGAQAATVGLLARLPVALAGKIGVENPERLFRLRGSL